MLGAAPFVTRFVVPSTAIAPIWVIVPSVVSTSSKPLISDTPKIRLFAPLSIATSPFAVVVLKDTAPVRACEFVFRSMSPPAKLFVKDDVPLLVSDPVSVMSPPLPVNEKVSSISRSFRTRLSSISTICVPNRSISIVPLPSPPTVILSSPRSLAAPTSSRSNAPVPASISVSVEIPSKSILVVPPVEITNVPAAPVISAPTSSVAVITSPVADVVRVTVPVPELIPLVASKEILLLSDVTDTSPLPADVSTEDMKLTAPSFVMDTAPPPVVVTFCTARAPVAALS